MHVCCIHEVEGVHFEGGEGSEWEKVHKVIRQVQDR